MTATPPRADLRTLAAEAVLGAEPWVRYNPTDMLVDAVLAAVLPEHRRLVLTEVADEVWAELRRIRLDARRAAAVSIEYINGWEDATGHLERFAAAAPETTPSAPVPAETALAVPEVGMGACDRCTGLFLPGDKIAYGADGRYHAEHFSPVPEAFDAGTHGRTAPPRGQNQRLDVAAGDADGAGGQRGEVRRLLAGAAMVLDELNRTGEMLLKTRADRDRLAAQVAHYQRVVEAAKAWYAACDPHAITAPDVRAAGIQLAAAVDALSDAGTDQTEDGHG